MPNRLLTWHETAKLFIDAVKKAANGDEQLERAIWYDLQTEVGNFPVDERQRQKYINGS